MANPKVIIASAVCAGALSVALCKLYKSKAGKKIRRELVNRCDEYKDKTEQFVQALCSRLSTSLNGQTEQIADNIVAKIKEVADFVQEQASECTRFQEPEFRYRMAVGAVVGALVGAGGALLLSPSAKQGSDLLNTIGQQGAKYGSILKNVLIGLQEVKNSNHTHAPTSKVDKAIDMALCGLQFIQGMQKR